MNKLRKVFEEKIAQTIDGPTKKKFKIYYQKKLTWHLDSPTTFDMKDYVFLVNLEVNDLSDVFVSMQGEIWSPAGEANDFIRGLNLTHTSMSVGDIAEDEEGNFFFCASVGWDLIKKVD